MDRETRELIERQKIKDTVATYCRGVDRRDWDLTASAYHSDGYDDHVGYKGDIPGLMEWLSRRHADIEQSMHFIGNCLIDFQSNTVAVAETYCVVFQRYSEAARETIRTWLGDQPLGPGETCKAEMACRYVDRFEKRDGIWRIAHRILVMEEVSFKVEPVHIAEDSMAKRDRSDALWRMLGGKS